MDPVGRHFKKRNKYEQVISSCRKHGLQSLPVQDNVKTYITNKILSKSQLTRQNKNGCYNLDKQGQGLGNTCI